MGISVWCYRHLSAMDTSFFKDVGIFEAAFHGFLLYFVVLGVRVCECVLFVRILRLTLAFRFTFSMQGVCVANPGHGQNFTIKSQS